MKLRRESIQSPTRCLVAFCLFGIVIGATAQVPSAFESLKDKVAEEQSFNKISPTDFMQGDCSIVPIDELNRLAGGTTGTLQYIYNALYQWTVIRSGADTCIFLQGPERRGLTPQEANTLLNASEMAFPVPRNPAEQTDPAIIRKAIDENPAAHSILIPDPIEGDPAQFVKPPKSAGKNAPQAGVQSKAFPAPFTAQGWAGTGGSTGSPWNTVARVLTTGFNAYTIPGSAVQITPYVFVTAAHVVSSNVLTTPLEIQVFPSDGMPSAVDAIYVGDYVVDPSYSNSGTPTSNAQHDIAFLRAPNPHYQAQYAPFFAINSSVDGPNVATDYHNDPAYDPYAFVQFQYFGSYCGCSGNGAASLFVDHPYSYFYYSPTNTTFYLDLGLGITEMGYKAGTTTPWYDAANGFLAGNVYQNPNEWEWASALYNPSQVPNNGVVSVYNAPVYSGMSGGPIFAGYQYARSVGGTVTNYTSFVLVGIIVASNGTVVNGAGSYALTTGLGSMSYNRSFVSTNSGWTVTSPVPYVRGTPNPVTIPSGSTSAPFTLSWSAPTYAYVSIYAKNNLAPYNDKIYCLGNTSSTGSAPENISIGETAQIFMTPYTHCNVGSTVAELPNPVLASVAITEHQ